MIPLFNDIHKRLRSSPRRKTKKCCWYVTTLTNTSFVLTVVNTRQLHHATNLSHKCMHLEGVHACFILSFYLLVIIRPNMFLPEKTSCAPKNNSFRKMQPFLRLWFWTLPCSCCNCDTKWPSSTNVFIITTNHRKWP